MKRCKPYALAAVLALMLCSRASSAMEIQMFDDIAAQDQQAYVAYLVKAVQQILIEQNQRDQAAKVHELFQKIPKGDRRSVGEVQFEVNLSHQRSWAAEPNHYIFTPPVGEVESALTVTMYQNGLKAIETTRFSLALRQLLRERPFWPKLPLRTK